MAYLIWSFYTIKYAKRNTPYTTKSIQYLEGIVDHGFHYNIACFLVTHTYEITNIK